jgi:uncharacterized protein DUF6325
MALGPVELVLLTFPGERADPATVAVLHEMVAGGHVTVLDLVIVTRDGGGDVRLTDADEDLSAVGLEPIRPAGGPLLSDADLDLVRAELPPASSAVVLVYEETWACRLTGAVQDAGGEVTLHVQLPTAVVETALAASAAT